MRKSLLGLMFCLSSSVYANDYKIIQPVSAKEYMLCWSSDVAFKEYEEIIGYSALGHVFLRAPEQNEYIVLHPYKKGAKRYGVFKSIKEFEDNILLGPSFKEYVLESSHVSKIRERLGKLHDEQVYIPAPYPFLGGDESIESYNIGNIWVMLTIVGQFHGVC